MSRPRVVVVGMGFGGLSAARALAPRRGQPAYDVVVVDRRNHHLFQPLLYQVATAGLEPADIAYSARGITRRLPGVKFVAGEVVGGDLPARRIELADGTELAYDHLVLAAGARTATFGVPGVAEHGYELKSLADALSFRVHLLRQFERCARDPALVDEGALTVVVVGGGPTGVEMAGAVNELYANVMRADFPEVDVSRARVVLVEMLDTVLPPFTERLRRHAILQLRSRGVELRLGVAVKAVHADAVELGDGEVIPTATVLWAAGVAAEPLGDVFGVETTSGGRIVVAGDLSLPDHPDVLVIGDLAAARSASGELLPQLAPVAMQQGRHVAEVLAARREQRDAPTFRYVDKGTMATIGRRAAVAQLPLGISFTGTLAWLAWLVLHIWFLIGFRNRVSVLVNWAWNYLTWDRAARVVPDQVGAGQSPTRSSDTAAATSSLMKSRPPIT